MVEGEDAGEGNSIGHNGKCFHGGIIVKTTIQVLCTLCQRVVDAIPNQDLSTTWIYAILRLQTIH